MTVSQRYPPTPLPYRKAQNLEPGLAELVQQSAGMLATLEGHMRGGEIVGTAGNPAPLNPSGHFGHDHSGGEYGVPLFRSIASLSNDYGLADIGTVFGAHSKAMPLMPGWAGGGETTRSLQQVAMFWVPPCDPVEGAYLSLAWTAEVAVGLTDLDAGDEVTLRVFTRQMLAEGLVAEGGVASADSAGARIVQSSDTLIVQPGALNSLVIELEVVRAAGGSSRGLEGWLTELELGVAAT